MHDKRGRGHSQKRWFGMIRPLDHGHGGTLCSKNCLKQRKLEPVGVAKAIKKMIYSIDSDLVFGI